MDFASLIGIFVSIGAVILGYTMSDGNLKALWLLSALVIVLGGSTGSVFISYGLKQLIKLPKMFLKLIITPKSALANKIDFIVHLAEDARRNGLLSLEKQLDDSQEKEKIDPLLKRGVLMVIDGAELDQIRSYMETDVSVFEQDSLSEIAMFEAFATYAPAYGMIGTIIGLIQVLANMESPEQMAAAMAVAFVTTLYGSFLANFLFLPAANKLKTRLTEELTEKEMIIEGVCSIRNGQNPKMLREKLNIYLNAKSKKPKEKTTPEADKDAKKT